MSKETLTEIAAGLLVTAFGIFFLAQSFNYGIGPMTRMGAGNFPLLLGIAAILLGVAIVVIGLLNRAPPAFDISRRIAVRPLAAVLGGVAAFAATLSFFGLVPAAAAATFVTALGDRSSGWRLIIGVTLVMSVCTWVVFILIFRLPVPAFRWSI